MTDPEIEAQRLAAEALAAGDATGWFERLYAGGTGAPWDRGGPHPVLVEWLAARGLQSGRAIVVGTGPGSDAAHLAALGYATTAFDISATAVAQARERFPDAPVEWAVADLLDLPDAWRSAFDLVVEIMTVQSLPPELHDTAIAAIASLTAPGGTLIYIGSAPAGSAGGPPWPLARDELERFAHDGGLEAVAIDRLDSDPPRWRAEFTRP
jgi:SAM-dependent methyltransferase